MTILLTIAIIALLIGFTTIAILLLYGLMSSSQAIVYIPNDRIGVVEKKFSRQRLQHGFIALNSQAGFQPEVLRGGFHFFMPFLYRVHKQPLVTISQGEIGYVFARDGAPLEPAQTLAS